VAAPANGLAVMAMSECSRQGMHCL
jgi:hypothetical protein